MKLEGADRIMFIRRGKHDFRQLLETDCFNYCETIHLRHLHIEEDDVGTLRLDHSDSIPAITAFAHDLDLAIVLQHSTNELSRQRLVVCDQRLNLCGLHPVFFPALEPSHIAQGISMTTVKPPSGAFVISKE